MDQFQTDRILAPVNIKEQARREDRIRSGIWRTLRRAAGQIPFMHDLVASYYCAIDPDTPGRVRGILIAALAYFVMPLDTIPDFIVGFGFGDDMAVLATAIAAVRGHLKPVHYEAAAAILKSPLKV